MHRISILLPAYNAVGTLSAVVESIRAQTLTDWELLLVDDGSTDGTADLADRLAEEDPRIRVFHRAHAGIAASLRFACENASAPFLARMDADDICLPVRLAAQAALLDANPDIGVAACRVRFGGDRNRNRGYAAYVDWSNSLLSPDEHHLNRFVESPLAHPAAMWRREVMERNGGYRDGPFPEDYELWLRWMDAGVRFAKCPETLLVWNDPMGRLSRTHDDYAVEAFYGIKCRYLARAVPEGRPVWLWGSGRTTRKRFRYFEELTRPFAGFLDIDPRKIGQVIDGRPVVPPESLPPEAFVLTGVATRGAREKMASCLAASGRRPGLDCYLCA